jgi:DNA-binding response OmpR family regulator
LRISLPLASDIPVSLGTEDRINGEPNLRILLLEDEGLVAMGIQALLGEAGHLVRHADCLSQALSELESFTPDLVLCDLGLPDGSGWEVVGRLRTKMDALDLGQVPVLVVSGWSDDQLDPLPQGMPPPAGFLHKPVDRRVLLERFRPWLQKQKSPPNDWEGLKRKTCGLCFFGDGHHLQIEEQGASGQGMIGVQHSLFIAKFLHPHHDGLIAGLGLQRISHLGFGRK